MTKSQKSQRAGVAGRRTFLQKSLLTGAAVSTGLATSLAAEPPEPPVTSPAEALRRLQEGNRRYTEFRLRHPDQTPARRKETARGQHPFAVILGCADSRVAPEIIFDQGLGDLFVVRVAGNISDDAVLGSIEYAVGEFAVPVVMVLGHEKCGAVTATLEAMKGGEVPGHLDALVKAIRLAVEKVQGHAGDLLDNAVRANVSLVVGELKAQSRIIAGPVREGRLKLLGARYDLDSGQVDITIS